MKKTLLIFAICLGISISFTSCKDKEHKHSEDTHMHDDTEEATNEKEVASNTLYQCTMDCEKGKSYIKEGSCPVCRMDLTPKEVKMDSDSEKEDHHVHDNEVEGHHHDEAHQDSDSSPSEGGRITKDAKVESTPYN